MEKKGEGGKLICIRNEGRKIRQTQPFELKQRAFCLQQDAVSPSLCPRMNKSYGEHICFLRERCKEKKEGESNGEK